MATEADIPAPICETRMEEGGSVVDQATNIALNKLPPEEKTQVDHQPPTIEGEIFLRTPSFGEVHCEAINVSPSDQPSEITATEETSSKRIQQNAEESNGLDKDEERGMVPVTTPGMKAGDILHDPDLDDVKVETQLSKDTTSDHHGTDNSFNKKMALSEESLKEASLLSGENKVNTLIISEGENMNLEVPTSNAKTGDVKTTKVEIPCNLTSDVSKEGEIPNDQNKTASEQEGLGNGRNFAANLGIAAEKVSQENSTFVETIIDATSTNDELQSKNDLSSSSCKEEDRAIQKGDRAVTTLEDSGMLLENTVNESQGDVEGQPKPLEGIFINHSNPTVTESTEESSLIQVDGPKMEHNEQLEKESQKLPLTEVSTGVTDDNESTVIHKVETEDEDLRKAEFFKNEKTPKSTFLKEEVQMAKPVEFLHVAPDNIKESNLGQDTKISSPEEQSVNANLQGIMSDYTEGQTVDVVDTQKEVLENVSTIVSNEEIEENSMVKVDGSEMKHEDHLEKETEQTSLPQSLARETSDEESKVMHEARIEDGEPQKAELCENEKIADSMLLKIESQEEKPVESLHVAPQDVKASALGQEIETTSSLEEQSLTAHPEGILDDKTDDRTLDAAEMKEETLENVATIVSTEMTEENSLIQVGSEHLKKEIEKPSLIEDSMGGANEDQLTVMHEVKIEDDNPRTELFKYEKNIGSNLIKEEVQIEKPVESLHVVLENIQASALGQRTETTNSLEEQSPTENLQGIPGDKTEEKTIDVTKSLPQSLAREASDEEFKVMHEARIEDGEPQKAELCENKKIADSMLLKIESQEEKPLEYLHVAPEDIKASALGQEIVTTNFLEEQSLTAHPEGILDDKPDDRTVDAAEKEETLENVATIVSNEKTEENSLIQVGSQMKDEEHFKKEIEKPSLIEDSMGDANDHQLTVMHEVKIEDENPRTELFEYAENIGSTLINEEVQIGKPVESLHVALENMQASALGQCTETSSLEEQSPTENLQGIPGDKTEEKTINAPDTNEETVELQNVAKNVSVENIDKESLTEVDGSQMKHEKDLEVEEPQLPEASTEDANDDESRVMHDEKIGDEYPRKFELFNSERNIASTLLKKEEMMVKPTEYLQAAPEDNKATNSSEDTETTCSLEEQSLTANPQTIMSDIKIDAADTEVTLEVQNVTTTIPHGKTEENSLIKEDCSKMEHEEHLEKESESPSLTEDPTGDINDESKTMHEARIRDEDLTRADILENEKNTESTTFVKEGTRVEEPIDSLQVATQDIKASASGQDTETSSFEEQILMRDPQEISAEKTEEKASDAADTKEETLENVAINVSNEDVGKNSLIQLDGSQMKHEKDLEMEEPSLPEASTEDANDDESTIMYEAKIGDEYLRKVELFDSEKNIDSTLLKKEEIMVKPTEYLQAAPEDNKATNSSEDTETTCSLEEQSLTTNPQAIMSDITIDAAVAKEVTLENVAPTIPQEDTKENSLIEEDCSQMEHGHVQEESENPFLTEDPTGDTNDDESKTIHEARIRNEDLTRAEIFENEKNTESTFVKEEARAEEPIDSLQVATQNIKASASGQDAETSSFEEQIVTPDPQEISGDKTEEETLENAATNVPNGDNEENSPMQIDGSQKPSLKEASMVKADDESIIMHEAKFVDEELTKADLEASMRKANDESIIMDEAKFVDEDLTKADLFENEKITKSILAKEVISIESLQVSGEDIKASATGQDRETSSVEEQSLTGNPQGIMGDHKEDKKNDATDAKEETPEDKNVATTISPEDTEENSLIQVDCSQMAHEEHLEKESETPPLLEAQTEDTNDDESKTMQEPKIRHERLKKAEMLENDKNTESTLVEEEARVEKPTDSSQIATEDIEASASGQDTETSSIKEQILAADSQEISGDKTEEKTINAADTTEETLENIATNVPNGDNADNSPIQINGSQKPSSEEVLTWNANDDDEPKIMHEDLIKADLLENKKSTESTLLKEEETIDSMKIAVEDIKAYASGQDIETSSLAANPQEVMDDHKEDKKNDTTDIKEEIPEDKIVATVVSNEDTDEISPIQLDGSQVKSEKHMEKESEKSPLTEASKRNSNTESTNIHEASTLEEGLSVKGSDICTEKVDDHMKDVVNQEHLDNSMTSHGAAEDQRKERKKDANDIISEAMEKKVDEDPQITNMDNDMTDNQHHLGTHSEATADETTKIFQEVDKSYQDADGYTDNVTQTINEDCGTKNNFRVSCSEEIKVGASSEDEKKELQSDTEVPKEIENADIKAETVELNEEEGYLKDLEMTTAVNIAAHEERGSDSIAVKNPYTKGSDVNEYMGFNIAEDPNCEQEESSAAEVSEEDTMISNENVANVTSLASEASELSSDQKVVGEANSCGDKTCKETMGVLHDGSVVTPTNENLEADPKESTEAQVPDGEKEAEPMQQDPEAGTGQKDVEEEQPMNASPDVSESNGVHGEEEKRNLDNSNEISENSNSVALEEVSSSNTFQESRRETLQEAESKEAQKQHEDLHVLTHIKDSSMGETEKDVQLCVASADESDIIQQMQKQEEASLPAPDENIIEKTDSKESEVVEDATKNKYVEHLEQEDTTKSFSDDQKATERQQEEAKSRQEKAMLDETIEDIKEPTSIPVANDSEKAEAGEEEETKLDKDEEEEAGERKILDFSSAAPVMIEARDQDVARLLSEATEENFTGKVSGEANTFKETAGTTESTVINNNTCLEDILVNNKSIGDFETKIHDEVPEITAPTPTATEGQEVESTSVGETSSLVSQSERAESEHANIGSVIEEESDSNELESAHGQNRTGYEPKDQDVKELKSLEIPLQGNNTENNEKEINSGNEMGCEVKSESVAEVTEDNIIFLPEKQELQNVVLLSSELRLETSSEIGKFTDESTKKMTCGANEIGMELGKEESSKDEENLNYDLRKEKVDDVIYSNTESKEILEPENLEKDLESIEQVQSCEKISKAAEAKTEEENLEAAAAEIKSETTVAEERCEPKETMKDDISSEKDRKTQIKEDDYHLDSCKEEVITESHLEDEEKQEETITKEIVDIVKNANENEKVYKFSEADNDKAVEEPEENLLANESIERSLHQKEQGQSVEEFTTTLDTEEEAHGSDHECIKTRTEDSREEINSSTVAFLEDKDNRTGADDLDNEMTKDEGLLNENSHISVIDAAAGELPEQLDENIICEAAPTKTVNKTLDHSEGNKGYANAIMMQQQEEDNKSKHESLPVPEFTKGKESEELDQKDEICSSDEVQVKDEENVMLSAGKSEEEAQKAETWSRPTEDQHGNTYIEAEKLEFSSHSKDTSEGPYSDCAQDIPKDNEKSTTKNEYSEEGCPNKSTDSQISTVSKDVEPIEQASKATRITAEIQEPKAGSDSTAVPEATGVDSQQAEEVSDECKGISENSISTESTKISASKIMQEYTVGTSLEGGDQETQDQLTKLHDLSPSSHVKDSEVKMAQKDGPVDHESVRDISEDVKELNESSTEVSNTENLVEADPNENIEAKVSSGGQEPEAIQKATISETVKQEIEEQQQTRTSEAVSEAKGVNCEEEKTIDDNCNVLIEKSHGVAIEVVPDTNIHQSSMDDAVQSAVDIKFSDIGIAEKGLQLHHSGFDGTDVTEQEVTPLPEKDKHVVLEADHTEDANPESSTGNKDISVIQHGDSAECSRGEVEILKLSKLEQEEAKCEHEERTSNETTKSGEKSESTEIDKPSLSDLLQVSVKETSQMADHSANEKEPIHREGLQAEKSNEAEHEAAKPDEEESSEQRRADLGYEAPVMVDAGDADVKVAHKKSHNILSGVGSKVKHSIAKVKKVITGKSSHPKPSSPK